LTEGKGKIELVPRNKKKEKEKKKDGLNYKEDGGRWIAGT